MSLDVRVTSASLALAALAATGCTIGPPPDVQNQIEQLNAISAEKDSLFQEILATNQLMAEISMELASVEAGTGPVMAVGVESPAALEPTSPDILLARIKDVTARVDEGKRRLAESERRLAESQRRIRALNQENDSLKARIDGFDASVTNFKMMIATQKQIIAALTGQVLDLTAEIQSLAALNAELEEEANTVYYVIATKKELLERGIVVEEGGSRFLLIFGKRGKTLRPSVELDTAEFVAIDKREVTAISFPDPEEEYRIASRQNLGFIATPPDEDGKLHEGIEIVAPDQFWSASKFLIIVQG